MIERGIREVCEEALNLVLDEPGCDVSGYFYEILSILDETEDDQK